MKDWPYCYKADHFVRPDLMMGEICIQCRIDRIDRAQGFETLSAGIMFRKPKRAYTKEANHVTSDTSNGRIDNSADLRGGDLPDSVGHLLADRLHQST